VFKDVLWHQSGYTPEISGYLWCLQSC